MLVSGRVVIIAISYIHSMFSVFYGKLFKKTESNLSNKESGTLCGIKICLQRHSITSQSWGLQDFLLCWGSGHRKLLANGFIMIHLHREEDLKNTKLWYHCIPKPASLSRPNFCRWIGNPYDPWIIWQNLCLVKSCGARKILRQQHSTLFILAHIHPYVYMSINIMSNSVIPLRITCI